MLEACKRGVAEGGRDLGELRRICLRAANTSFVERVEVIELPEGQRGVVAWVELPPNQYICEYVGEVVTVEEEERRLDMYEEMALKRTYMLHVSACVCVVHRAFVVDVSP